MRQWSFLSPWGEERAFPHKGELGQLLGYEVIFSLSRARFLPLAVVSEGGMYSNPGIRLRRQLKDIQDPSKGWEVFIERIVLHDGRRVNEQVGPYERFVTDLTTGEMKVQFGGAAQPKKVPSTRDVYLSMITDLVDFEEDYRKYDDYEDGYKFYAMGRNYRVYLVEASFVDQATRTEYKSVGLPQSNNAEVVSA